MSIALLPIPAGRPATPAIGSTSDGNARAGRLAHLRRRWLTVDVGLAVLLFLGTAALYARTAGFSFVNYDDGIYVGGNGHLALGLSPAGLGWAFTAHNPYWHPVTWICYLVMAQLFGPTPGAPHVFNALLFSSSAAMLFVFWKRATGMRGASLIAAMLWAWHPLRVESVAWVSETKDVLGCFFWIATLLCYLSYVRRPSALRYTAVSFVFLLSLGSKPTVVTLPAALLLLDFWPLRRWPGRSIERLVVEKLPWLLLAGVIAAVAYWAQRHGGALKLDSSFPLRVRFANAVTSYVLYMGQTVWPARLAIFYPYPDTIGHPIPAWAWLGAIALLMAISAGAVALWRRSPAVAVGWFWFIGVMIPMSGLVQAGLQARADRHTLIPSIGLVAAVVWPATEWARRMPTHRRSVFVALAFVLAVAEWTLSFVQVGYWRNSTTVFAHAVAVTRQNYLAEGGLAVEYAADPQTRSLALQLARDAVAACPHVLFGYSALGLVHEAMGEHQKALAADLVCAKLEPGLSATWEHLGDVRVKMEQFPGAEGDYRRALQLEPENFLARNNLAICLAHDGRIDAAVTEWQRVVAANPRMGDSQGWLADALRMRGDRAGAETHYRAALAAGERRASWETNDAWLVATDPASTPADVEAVLPAARDAVEQSPPPSPLAPLALDAYAATLGRCGQFDQAAAVARRGVIAAVAAHQSALARSVDQRRARYASGQPFLVGP